MLIRPYTPDDLPAVLALNNANVPEVNELDAAGVARLTSMAELALVAEVDGAFAGFCWTFGPGLDYESLNYAWFSARYSDFSYLDRIAVHPDFRRFGVGRGFYDAVRDAVAGSRTVVLCEVNVRPPNEVSLAFHERVGFREVGRQDTDGGTKTVCLMEWRLA